MKFGGDDIDRMLEAGTGSSHSHRGGPPPRYGGRGGYNAVPPPSMNHGHGRGHPRDDGPPRYGRRDDRGPYDRRDRSRSRDRGGYGGRGGRGGGGGRGGYRNDIEFYGSRRQRSSQSPSRYGYDDDRRMGNDQEGIDRDSRTVFACQIHPKCDERDIFEFFSSIGKVVDVQLIRDNRTFKSKGLCYVEFEEKSSVAQALSLSGQSLAGFPVSVQLTQAEKNRAAQQAAQVAQQVRPMKLYVSNIHVKVTEEDIRPVFSAFGEILSLEIKTDHRHKSKGYGFVEFKKEVDAMGAMQQLNDLEILGQKIKVAAADQPSDGGGAHSGGVPVSASNGNSRDNGDRGSYHNQSTTKISDEVGNGGLNLSTADKLNLMAKLGRGQVKPAPHPNLNTSSDSKVMEKGRGHGNGYGHGHGLPTQQYSSFNNNSRSRCVLLSNMFNPATETDPDFDMEIREDVREEVGKFGKVLHIYVDKTNAAGLVYLKFNQMDEAQRSIEALNGRWFAKQQIKATYYEEKMYNKQFNL